MKSTEKSNLNYELLNYKEKYVLHTITCRIQFKLVSEEKCEPNDPSLLKEKTENEALSTYVNKF